MTENTLYVGLDTDKKGIDVAVAEPLPGGEVRYVGKIANDAVSLDRTLKRLAKGGRELMVCYEAGPCGYGIYRRLNGRPGVRCQVIAPSLMPRQPGNRVKTNRRDALTLARLLRAEELTAIWVPDAAHEAMRDLVRARGAAVEAMRCCRQQIKSFLLRQEIDYQGHSWTKKHRAWLGGLRFAAPAHRLMFGELLSALDEAQARVDRLNDHIAELVPAWSLNWLVEAVQALRGFQLVGAAILAAEIGDPRRFDSPRQLMAFVGLVICENSTGDRRRQGGLTKTGNRRARTMLTEAGWTYTRPATRPKEAAVRAAPEVRAIAEKARHRLSRRYRHLCAAGKRSQVALAAVARELVGFIWALAHAAGPRPA